MQDAVSERPWIRAAIATCRPHLMVAAGFSAIGNLLYLSPSLFMLQVYDRVVPTGGIATLVAIGLLTLAALAAMATFEWLRSRVLARASLRLEAQLTGPALDLALRHSGLSRLQRAEVVRDVDTLRQGIASPAIVALLDLPWTPIYIIVAFMLHWSLGVMTIGAAGLLLVLALANERATSRPMKLAGDAASIAHQRQAHATAHASEVRALGMARALVSLQMIERSTANTLQMRASFAANTYGGWIKFVRLALQSAVLGLGAVLVIANDISAGSMIAASLLMARALAPIEQVVGAWKTILQSRIAFTRLDAAFGVRATHVPTQLPAPTGTIQVENLTVLASGTERVALADASFSVTPGEVIGIIGPSGSGKSTLIRAMAGGCEAARGHVRFDGVSRADWDGEALAAHIGFMPQDYVLFAGSVKENISRFAGVLGGDPAAIDRDVLAAAQAVGAHEMIGRLPMGYDTQIGGAGGVGLSAGQAQRIALARALYGNPAILLLDEPTANLDAEAQQCFASLLGDLRQRGVTILFASHSMDMLAAADKLLVMAAGRVQRLAPRAELRPAESEAPVTPASFKTRVAFQ
ncbi:type I secretion system permease/ATPase [Sphingomonas sanguinis]|uniref:Type I secretion system permease/ATPase n=1 Tax=Sphingomonas sanguinis TaxID=33051 RepID=A0ABU5LPH2_9SPHN|nr:type I secretion system permease/ATPase [Sphingomonas sanguinis]MDZ7281822.1 type I secretion system permease/ATPase [Sphingomonas sanguinis]